MGHADFALTLAMWSVMMIVMMAPSAMPVTLLYSKMRNGGGSAALFGAGHLSVWIVFSVFATLAQLALRQAQLLSPGMTINDPAFSGVLLVLVGLYQLTPGKSKCLTKCQKPLDFPPSHFPVVGSALKLHGQPQSQLHATSTCPVRFQRSVMSGNILYGWILIRHTRS